MTKSFAFKIGLALSGGGALGAAHIGILEELERRHIKLQFISGVSSGAIIGALYADGGLPAVHSFLARMEAAGIINKKANFLMALPDVLFAQIRNLLLDSLKAKTFEALPISFSCVASDIITGEMVVLERGNLVPAIMASSAYAGVFPIQRTAGRWLVDGGVTRNLPVDVLRRQGAEFVIGSSLYCISYLPNNPDKPGINRFQALLRSAEILEVEFSRIQLKDCDFVFAPPISTFKWYELEHVNDILQEGRNYALEHSKELMQIMEKREKSSHSFIRILLKWLTTKTNL
jgi:NTE family protein